MLGTGSRDAAGRSQGLQGERAGLGPKKSRYQFESKDRNFTSDSGGISLCVLFRPSAD